MNMERKLRESSKKAVVCHHPQKFFLSGIITFRKKMLFSFALFLLLVFSSFK